MKDLFETPDLIPANVQAVLADLNEGADYKQLQDVLKRCEALGYTFEYYLDAEPFGLVTIAYKLFESTGLEFYTSTERNDEGLSISHEFEYGVTLRVWFPTKELNHFTVGYMDADDTDWRYMSNEIGSERLTLTQTIQAINNYKNN